ncbi:MAG: Hpt domain-containing protein [Azoarcus sp.]|nr:Hpt domain-containing protein [Azoarcus sp.]
MQSRRSEPPACIETEDPKPMPPEPSTFSHFNPHAMQDDLMDSPQVVRSVLTQFLKWEGRITSELRAAKAAGDIERLGRAAHTLHGTLAQLHAIGGTTLAAKLELGCTRQKTIPTDVHADLLTELESVTREVASYLNTPQPA